MKWWVDRVLLVVAVALMALHLLLLLRAMVLRIKWLELARGFVTICKAVALTDCDQAIQEKMQETRLSNARFLLWPLMHLSFVVVGTTVLKMVRADPLSLSRVQTWGLLVVFGALLVLHLCPRLLNGKTMGLFYHVAMAFNCAFVAPYICPFNALGVVSGSCTGMMGILAMASSDSFIFGLWNSAFVALTCVSYSLSSYHTTSFWSVVIVRSSTAWVLCWLVQRFNENRHQRGLKVWHLEERDLANNKLLKIFYDVVLEVDADLAITSAAPELARWLPNTAGHAIPTIQGSNFVDLILEDEDRQHFVERMQRSRDREEPSVEVMHLRMRHGHNDSLGVELFSYQFACSMDRRRHLIGIREFGDEVGSRPRLAQPGVDLGQTLTLKIDALPQDLPIMEVSEDLRRALGHVPLGFSCCHLVDHATDFTLRLERAINEAHGDSDQARSNPFRVQLRPRGRSDMRILADCSVSLDEVSDEGESGGAALPVTLYFSNLEQAPFQSQRQSSSSWGSGSSSSGSRPRRAGDGTPSQLRSQSLGSSAPRPSALGTTLSL